jgi:hypothetical protein
LFAFFSWEKNKDMKRGAFQIARKLFDSELWLNKPAAWSKIWIYIIGKVNHKDNGTFKRGENYFNFAQERRLIGKDITENQIKRFCQFAVSSLGGTMISTRRSTRGMVIKVSKYELYQTLDNYSRTTESTTSSTSKAREKHADKQECKNVKKEDIGVVETTPPLMDSSFDGKTPQIKVSSPPNTDFKEIISYYYKEYQDRFGDKPEIAGKDCKLLKTRLKDYPPDKLKEIISLYLQSKKCEKLGGDLGKALSTDTLNAIKENRNF